MINLNERLSEFSYGYGVIREASDALAAIGVHATPFLPSLIHENEVGFDVAFDRPGVALLLQFKLGQKMERYRSVPPGRPAPPGLASPFWRFHVNTAEAQFTTLLNAEQNENVEVYYVAPRFSSWWEYSDAYLGNAVLDRSIMITPRAIDHQLRSQRTPAGKHRVIYDDSNIFICSEPVAILETQRDDIISQILKKLQTNPRPLGELVKQWTERPSVRASDTLRFQRLEQLRARARTPEDAAAAIFAIDAWSIGAQAIFITDPIDSQLTS
jgi:hypothetical protein